MSALDDLIQAVRDMEFHRTDYWCDAFLDARSRAEKACREVFPIRAKPLGWSGGGYRQIASTTFDYDYCVDDYGPGWIARLRYANRFVRVSDGVFVSMNAAKQACEDHHQAKFKEQLA